MNWITRTSEWVRAIAHISILLVALGVIWQGLFGTVIPFGNIVGNIQGLVAQVGSAGLVGLITVGILVWLFSRLDDE